MAGNIATIISAIRDRMEALEFKAAAAVFDFDAVPDSIIDRAYRIETRLLGNEYIMGNAACTTEAIEIYVAYKLGRAPALAWARALDDREDLERDIINDGTISALPQSPLLFLDNEASAQKLTENHLVSKVVFRCDYIRSVESTI